MSHFELCCKLFEHFEICELTCYEVENIGESCGMKEEMSYEACNPQLATTYHIINYLLNMQISK